MSLLCNSCKKQNRDIAKYCKYCGTKIVSKTVSLEDIVGLDNIKSEIQTIINMGITMRKRSKEGGSIPRMNLHTILIGNTGTGKTKIGNILCKSYHTCGITSKDEAMVIDAVDYAKFSKDFEKNFNKAKGGIVFIDDVHKLVPAGYSGGQLIPLDKLIAEMDKSGYDPIVILAGLPQGFREYLDENHDARGRFNYIFELPDFNADEMYRIALKEISRDGFTLNNDASERLKRLFRHLVKIKDKSFSNGHLVLKEVEDIIKHYYIRISHGAADDNIITSEDILAEIPKEKSVEEILSELDSFVGMENIKQVVSELTGSIMIQKERISRGIGIDEKTGMHLVITGNPGTGKTTVARKLGEVFQATGFLDRGHVVEVDRTDLVAEYVGQTGPKVNAKIDEAVGGILFIDEAYTLAPDDEGGPDKFGKEAIEALMKRMEDDRDKFVVIAAGYKEEMERFLGVNPGLRSRFDRYLHLEDYAPEELLAILKIMATKKKYRLHIQAEEKLLIIFQDMYEKRDKNFGNGRDVRKLFEDSEKMHSARMSSLLGKGEEISNEVFTTILAEDIEYDMPKPVTLEDVMAELKNLVGMDNIKSEIRDLIDTVNIQKKRADVLGDSYLPALHIVIKGNPGTGKTTVARILGKVFKSIDILPKGHVVEVDRKDLVGQYVGSTPKKTDAKIEESMGGILFIDEAYTLAPEGVNDHYGKEAIDTLLKRMEDDRGKFIVIAAGYPKEMENFINANPGLESRFTRTFHIEDYSPDELFAIFCIMTKNEKYEIDHDGHERLKALFEKMYEKRDKNFANGREVRNIFDKTITLQAKRLSAESVNDKEELLKIKADDVPRIYEEERVPNIEDTLGELERLIGLSAVKNEIKGLINYLSVEKARAARGGKESALNLHFVFMGNPGTGKTTVARILSDLFKSMGLLPRGHIVEVDRSGLVAEYVGQTATKTNKVIDSAIGGVLFIDEAYTLAPGGMGTDFGKEAIDILLKRMEDDRGKFIVIAAGYFNEMDGFINTNPGLASRFTRYIDFEDYTSTEMKEIFKLMTRAKNMNNGEGVEERLERLFQEIYENRDNNFANGRTVRNIFEMVLRNQAARIFEEMQKGEVNPEILTTFTLEDFKI